MYLAREGSLAGTRHARRDGDAHHDDVQEAAGGGEGPQIDDGEPGRPDPQRLEPSGERRLAMREGWNIPLIQLDGMT
jgi:hypothetical protein